MIEVMIFIAFVGCNKIPAMKDFNPGGGLIAVSSHLVPRIPASQPILLERIKSSSSDNDVA
jgi:hypothetical protein